MLLSKSLLHLVLVFFSSSLFSLVVKTNPAMGNVMTGEAQNAARSGDVKYFTTLMEVVDDPIEFLNKKEQSTEQTPLLAAVLAGQTEIVKILMDTGVDVEIPEKDGYTVMHAAAFQGRAEIAKLLIERGIEVNTNAPDGFTPLHRTLWTGNSKRHLDTMGVLITEGKVEVDFVSPVGKPASLIAMEMKNYEALQMLLRDYGADPNFRTKRGDALVHVAIRAQDNEALNVLLANGADVMLRDGKRKSCRKIAKQLRSKAILETINRAYEEEFSKKDVDKGFNINSDESSSSESNDDKKTEL